MSARRYRITPALGQRICGWIRAGGYPHVAAEAAGVPRDVFARWLEKGRAARARRPYRELAEAVLRAQAEARLAAELKTYGEATLTWLRCGPGKCTVERSGWTTSSRSLFAGAERSGNVLLQKEVQALFRRMLGSLHSHPDARIVLANAVDNGVSF